MDLDLSEATRNLIRRTEAAEPSQHTPEFERLHEGLLYIQVCTSLSDEEATERANLLPPGDDFRWALTAYPGLTPVPCADRPDTHRHLIFEC